MTQARKLPSTSTRLLTSNTYDELNRPVTRAYNDPTPSVLYCYDGRAFLAGACTAAAVQNSRGQLTGVGNTHGYTNYTHDDQGRIVSSTQRVDADRVFTY